MIETKDKIREAEFFLEKAESIKPSSDDFRWYLSAFLSAARSIRDFLHAEYKKSPGFLSWESEVKKLCEEDGLIQYCDKHRQLAVHQRALKNVDTISRGDGGITLSLWNREHSGYPEGL